MALLALTLALLAMTVATTAYEVIPLDMAPDSFDDRYQGCGPAMRAELPALNRSDTQNNPLFAKVWPMAVKQWQGLGSPLSPLSSSAQAIAIMAYTMVYLHKQFNDKVRVAGRTPQEYRDNFHFKTLHFLLTDALGTLRVHQTQKCHCVFRGVDKCKFKANVGDVVRFGQFASTSHCKGEAKKFGITTMFTVRTCYGVDIMAFSNFKYEKEVLIPPFEKFKVINVIDYGGNVEIHLDSIGIDSKYNCEWVKGKRVFRAFGIPEVFSSSAQFWQRPQGPSDSRSFEELCGRCYNHGHTQGNKATTATIVTLATMASMWSLWSPLAL